MKRYCFTLVRYVPMYGDIEVEAKDRATAIAIARSHFDDTDLSGNFEPPDPKMDQLRLDTEGGKDVDEWVITW